MTLIFANHSFQYEIERLFRSFFPPVKIALSFDPADALGEYCLTERENTPQGITLRVSLCAEGKALSREETVPADTSEKEQERVLRRFLNTHRAAQDALPQRCRLSQDFLF